jgi:pimeloyl-ACP methyl ester carboxylesterase
MDRMRIIIAGLMLTALTTGSSAGTERAQQFISGYAPVNGLRMYYEIHGIATGYRPPLVLLHGGGSTIETSFGKVLGSFARTRKVIAFEQQGHGRTADVDRPFSFERSADDAASLLGYLKIGKADFYGYSNGGNIALQIAIRHPELVRKLIVASAMFKREGLSPEFWESMKHATLESMPAELKEAYLKTAPHPERLQAFHDKSVRRMLEFTDWPSETLRSIDAPTMVMVADGDIVRPEHAVEMFRLLPRGRLAVLPDTDHMTLVRRADWQASMIEAFLDASAPNARAMEGNQEKGTAIPSMFASRTVSVTIGRPPGKVYEFASNPENLPKWAKGLGTSVSKQGADWIVDTPQGPMKIRFAENNAFGVLDHHVTTTAGSEVYVPIRVLPNGTGSEVIITLFRSPDMTDEKYAEDMRTVERDLRTLKDLLESGR